MKRIIIIAGPNGAGKTTYATEILLKEADCPEFINADLIAAGLSPFQPQRAALRAGRLMIQTIDEMVSRGNSFAFETTLSGKGYVRKISHWRAVGYSVSLIFLLLPSEETAIARVAARVNQGGHPVPADVVRRRFVAGKSNFENIYRSIVDSWAVYDNSGVEPILVDRGTIHANSRT